jgi:glycosyltransferase involved in cell wall biosynthesis
MRAYDNKIKVIHLVSDLSIGGIQKVVLDICSSADLSKYSVSICVLNHKMDLLDTYELPSEIEIKAYDYQFEEDFTLIGYFKNALFKSYVLKRAKAVVENIVKKKPDILHLHLHPLELMIGVLIEERIHCKLIFTEHLKRFDENGFKLRILRLISRFIYRRFNIIAVSSTIYDDLKKFKLLGSNKKMVTIKNKINLNFFNPILKKPKDYLSIVYVARIGYPKGHEDLIHAWSKVNQSGIAKKLFLVGPDSLNNKIQNLTCDLKVSESVIFMGSIYNIKDFLNECDFAVFPSYKEGLPIALLEKMAMNLPVIVSNIDELTSIVEDHVNGLVFTCGNVVELSEKINTLSEDTQLRIRLGEAARKTVESRFGTNNVAYDNEQFYESVIGSK